METADLERNLEGVLLAKDEGERIVIALASSYGLRACDFTIAWDGGSFEASRDEHELMMIRKEGSQAAARIDRDTLLNKDAWTYFRHLEAVFVQLNRRQIWR
jgi:hypothetical protein